MQNKQRLELADYEAENLARLQKTFARKWEFVFMQAEAQAKSVSLVFSSALLLLRPLAGAKYCNRFVCLSVTLALYK